MWEVMNACVIMHNMIIESEHANLVDDPFPYEFQGPLADTDHNVTTDFGEYLAMHTEIRDEGVHNQLQHDLMEHLWMLKGLAASA